MKAISAVLICALFLAGDISAQRRIFNPSGYQPPQFVQQSQSSSSSGGFSSSSSSNSGYGQQISVSSTSVAGRTIQFKTVYDPQSNQLIVIQCVSSPCGQQPQCSKNLVPLDC